MAEGWIWRQLLKLELEDGIEARTGRSWLAAIGRENDAFYNVDSRRLLTGPSKVPNLCKFRTFCIRPLLGSATLHVEMPVNRSHLHNDALRALLFPRPSPRALYATINTVSPAAPNPPPPSLPITPPPVLEPHSHTPQLLANVLETTGRLKKDESTSKKET